MKRFFLILACLCFLIHPAMAQGAVEIDEEAAMEEIELSKEMIEYLSDKIETYTDGAASLLESVDGAQMPQLNAIKRYANALDLKWANFYESQQALIASDEQLMEAVTIYLETRQRTTGAIDAREKTLTQFADFVAAERIIAQNVKPYEKMYKDALTYSLVEKTAPELEKLKAKDLMLMEELTQQYTTAQQAYKDNKVLKKRWEKLDNNFIDIKGHSQQIQQMEYKPFVQRIKDHVMSLAAVAIIVMFFSFIIIRIKAARDIKKAAEEAKKQRDLLNQNIPTI